MATYYGYKERQDPTKSMIDWSGITKEITDGLYAESKRREEEKFTLDQNYIKQLNDLNEYSQGLDPTVNQAMLGYVQNYRDYLMQNHKMMKQGVITVNDSKIAKQGSLDSFNNLNNVIKGVNGKLAELQKAGGELNDDQMKSLAELVQFKNQQLLIDPKTGTASLAKRNEDGTIDKNTIVPVGAAYQMFTPYEQRSINDDIQKPIKGIGEWTTAASYLTSVSDLRDNPEYNTWVDSVVKEMTADKRTLASYGASLGLTISDGDIIKKNNAGSISYELTPEAKGEVEEAIKSAIEVRIGREVKKTAPSAISQTNAANKKNQMQTANSLIKYLKTGDQPTGAGILGSGAAQNITQIKIDKAGGIGSVTLSDGKTISTDLKKGEKKEEISVGDLFVAIAPNLGISPDVADEMVETQGLANIPLAEAYPDLVKTSPKPPAFTFVTQENVEALNTTISESGRNDYTKVLMQLNAIAAPRGLPPLKLGENNMVYFENSSGQPIILANAGDPPALLKAMDEKLGMKDSKAAGDEILLNQSEVKNQ